MKILITGITGRVGANVARHFISKGHQVRGFVWPNDRATEKIGRLGAEIVEGDLKSLEDVRRAAAGQEAILHMGAAFQAGGPFTPEQYFDINVKGTFNILEASLELGDTLKHVICTSTDATMDKYPPEGLAEPIREDSLPLVTTAWYGYSKVLDEHLVNRYVRAHNLRATVFRFANVWGAGEILTWPQFFLKTFLKQFEGRTDAAGRETYAALQAVDDGQERLIVACDRNGRPWKKHNVEVRDLVRGFDAALGKPSTFGRVYQLAAPEPFTWDDAVPYLADKLGLPYSRVNLTGMNPTFYEYDLGAAKRDFGYDPQIGFRDTVDEAIRYRDGASDAVIPTR